MAANTVGFVERRFLHAVSGVSDENLIALIEGFLRVRAFIDPRTHSRALRVRSTVDGAARFESSVYCVFVCMCKRRVPSFTLNALVALKNLGVNVFLVNNTRPLPTVRAQLHELCHTYMERANIGRDFGAYKDALRLVFPLNPSRLLLLNDSLYYFPTGVEDMLRGLIDSEADVAGISETHEHHYHIQSFALSFSPRIINHRRFRRYWRTFMPLSTRRWSIHMGEVGLTQLLVKRVGITIEILYSAEDLYNRLESESEETIFQVARIMPVPFRMEHDEELVTAADKLLNRELINYFRRFAGSQAQLASEEHKRLRDELTTIAQLTANLQYGKAGYVRYLLLMLIINHIAYRNAMSVGAFPFIRYLGMPAFKRDIVYRELYTIPEVDSFLETLPLPETLHGEILDDLRAKGYSLWLKGIRRFMYRVGII